MSIIHEALKKTQDRIQKSSPSPLSPAPQPSGSGKKSSSWSTMGIILFFLLAAGVAFLFVRQDFPPKKLVQKPTVPQNVSAPQPSPAPEQTQVPALGPSALSLVLNGIMTMDNEQFALINNQIYRVGDTVDGKLLINIGTNNVELSDKSEKIILTTGTTSLTK